MNAQDQNILNKILDNAFEIRAAYHGLVEGYGYTYPLGKLADSQHRQVTDLLQLFWHLGITALTDARGDDFKVTTRLYPSLLKCIALEKAKVDLCSRFIKASDHSPSKNVASGIRTHSKSVHLSALYNFAQGETGTKKIRHFPIQWRSERASIEVNSVLVTKPRDHRSHAGTHS